MSKAEDIQTKIETYRPAIIQFMREICAIPSMDSKIGPVG